MSKRSSLRLSFIIESENFHWDSGESNIDQTSKGDQITYSNLFFIK